MTQQAKNPIGIFDSGIGGLTVASAVHQLLPQENLIYFGDTAHLPYGDKSTAAIQSYSIKICNMLLEQGCKLILIACNSASAAAYDLVNEYVGSRAKVLNVIDPVIYFLRECYQNKRVGLIGTKQTVQSNIYNKKVDDLNAGILFRSLATPLLVPMIEEGFSNKKILIDLISEYLSHPDMSGIDALILGCTHYPVIKAEIESFYSGKVDIIDSSKIVAETLQAYLKFHNLHNQQGSGEMRFFVSDYTNSFADYTQLFFGKRVELEKYPLWE